MHVKNIMRIVVLMALVVFSGCTSSPGWRLARYRPDVDGVQPWTWKVAPADATKLPVDPEQRNTGAGKPDAGFLKVLKSGDKVSISLMDIPDAWNRSYVIDDRGSVNLPLVGSFLLDGKKPFEAETQIEKEYIDKGFYKKVKVVVISQEDEYYVRGEVKREGKFPLSQDTTLLRAITAAGGFTDFAKTWLIEVKRGERVTIYDIGKIADGKDSDPQIKHSDVITVPKRSF